MVRVCEAEGPGHTTSVDSFQKDTPHLKVKHLNVDIWGDEVEQYLKDTDADIVCCCETRVTQVRSITSRLLASGWAGVWGAAIDGPSCRSAEEAAPEARGHEGRAGDLDGSPHADAQTQPAQPNSGLDSSSRATSQNAHPTQSERASSSNRVASEGARGEDNK